MADDKNHTFKCEGKCALGELGCQLGLLIPPRWESHISPKTGLINQILNRKETLWSAINGYEPAYYIITETLGFPSWLTSGENLPHIGLLSNGTLYVEFDHGWDIDFYIYRLNDAGYTYAEIIEFLETTFGDIED